MSKVMFVLLLAVATMLPLTVLGINVDLTIDSVMPNSVSGTLTIVNDSQNPIQWEFPSAGTFHLTVDGVQPDYVYPSILTWVTIPPNTTYTETVTHHRSSAYSSGSHIAQTVMVLDGYPPIGPAVSFQAGISGYTNLSYSFELTEVHPQYVDGTLTMTNPSSIYWQMSFPYTMIAWIKVDGHAPSVLLAPMVTDLIIAPGASHSEPVFHCQTVPYSQGTHIAQVHLICGTEPFSPPVGEPVTFTIGSSGINDPDTPPMDAGIVRTYPNPFGLQNNLIYRVADGSRVKIGIYNSKGQLLRTLVDDMHPAGIHKTVWDGKDANGSNVPNGVYFYLMKSGDHRSIERVSLFK
jgi:hypothetical protein